MTRLLTVLVVAACSGRAPAPTHPPPGGGGTTHGTVGGTKTGAEVSSGGVTPAPDPRVSEADCHAAIDHVIDLDVKERPADQQLTADQLAELRASVRKTYLGRCREQDRAVIACIRAATSRAAIQTCEN